MTDTLTETEIAKIQDIVIRQLEVRREQLTLDAKLVEDLGADSLDVVEITIQSEEAFGITIPDEEAEEVKTVEELYEAVGRLLGRGR